MIKQYLSIIPYFYTNIPAINLGLRYKLLIISEVNFWRLARYLLTALIYCLLQFCLLYSYIFTLWIHSNIFECSMNIFDGIQQLCFQRSLEPSDPLPGYLLVTILFIFRNVWGTENKKIISHSLYIEGHKSLDKNAFVDNI